MSEAGFGGQAELPPIGNRLSDLVRRIDRVERLDKAVTEMRREAGTVSQEFFERMHDVMSKHVDQLDRIHGGLHEELSELRKIAAELKAMLVIADGEPQP